MSVLTEPVTYDVRMLVKQLIDQAVRTTLCGGHKTCVIGTELAYKRGCRCDRCRAAATVGRKARRQKADVREWQQRNPGKEFPYPTGDFTHNSNGTRRSTYPASAAGATGGDCT